MNIWTKTFPTKPGYYWFYGRRSKCAEKARLTHVKVSIAGSGEHEHLIYIADGAFIYQSEGTLGIWCSNNPPEIPVEMLNV